jgi:uncharacterized protein
MYRKGIGILQDYAAALTWFRKAADKGDASAQHALGGAYFEGLGVPQDYAAAASWYQKAADQGQINSQAVLASLYELGWGVPQDYVKAHKWANLAAAAGAKDAIEFRDKTAARMTPAQIAEAQKLAREWKPNLRSAKRR